MPAPGFRRRRAELRGAGLIRELLTLSAALSEPLTQSLSPSWCETDYPRLVQPQTLSLSLLLLPSLCLSPSLLSWSQLIVSICLIMMDSEKKNVLSYVAACIHFSISPHLSCLLSSHLLTFPFLVPAAFVLPHLNLHVCLPGGVWWSDGARGVQQQRSEDQLHPADPGETQRRPQRGQESTVITEQLGYIALRLWVSYRSPVWFHNAGGGV